MSRTVASIEARMGSSRLPGKMMMLLDGTPVIAHLVGRMRQCRYLDGLIIATTENPADEAIAEWAANNNVDCFRGSEDDVLARVLAAQESMNADVVVELCGDTPFLDPTIVNLAVSNWHASGCDLLTTARKRLLPDGQDVEIFPIKALRDIAERCTDKEAREHVSAPFYREDRWDVLDFRPPGKWKRPELRLVLDTPADANFLGALAAAAAVQHGPLFGLDALLEIYDASEALQILQAKSLEAVA
ncbi:MAG: NTP transferase domain-containing protein [Rhodospirillales bacterium]|nr:NTP transferase domain-containing protein [Rhodospirillales bacterium]